MTQEMLDGLSAGMGAPLAFPSRAGESVWGEGGLEVPADSAAPTTQNLIERKTTSTCLRMKRLKKHYTENQQLFVF